MDAPSLLPCIQLNPDIAYVGTAQGGLYRTTNGGATWTPLMDNALSLAIGTLTFAV